MKEIFPHVLIAFVVMGVAVTIGYPQKPATVTPAEKPATEKSADFLGGFSGETYRNEFFGLEFALPKGWKVNDAEEVAAATEMGLDAAKGKSEKANKALQEAALKEVILVSGSKKPLGAFGNSMVMLAVRKQPSRAVTASMVAEATKSVLTQSPTITLLKDTRTELIAGRKFALVDYSMKVGETVAFVKSHVTVIDGYAVSFSFSYVDEADVEHLNKLLQSLKFTTK